MEKKDTNDWPEWSNHVLIQLEQLNKSIKELGQLSDSQIGDIKDRLSELINDINIKIGDLKLSIAKDIENTKKYTDEKVEGLKAHEIKEVNEALTDIKIQAAKLSGIIAAVAYILKLVYEYFSNKG